MYPYKIRQVNNSFNFMLEIRIDKESKNFTDDFLVAIAILNPELISKEAASHADNNIVLHFNSILGKFSLSQNFQYAYVTSIHEELLLIIDSRLILDAKFVKID